jgi:hypothetical protein
MESFSFSELASEYRRLGKEKFRRTYGHPFLVMKKMPETDSDWLDLKTEESLVTRPKNKNGEPSERSAIPLKKTRRNAYKSKITVGRARNNDIVLRASKISKVHAAFIPVENGYELVDMGSANGTVLNDVRISRNEPVPLKSGDRINLWRYEFEFHEPDSFTRMIKVLS